MSNPWVVTAASGTPVRNPRNRHNQFHQPAEEFRDGGLVMLLDQAVEKVVRGIQVTHKQARTMLRNREATAVRALEARG